MPDNKFNPNRLSFDEGLKRINEAVAKSKLKLEGKIVTSKDKGIEALENALETKNVPAGFKKFQLPLALNGPSQLFISTGEPGAVAGKHAHKDGDGIRFIAGGSIIFEGKELSAGDWMFIPKGVPYEFKVGRRGALMCYCYCCCCA